MRAGAARLGRLAVPLFLLLRAPAAAGPSCPAPGAAMTADPRAELLSVLLLLRAPRRTPPEAKSPYQRDAERWFAAYASHPAAAEAAALLKRDPGLPARLVLRLSPPPALAVAAPIPDRDLDAAGGRPAAMRFVDALGDFARRSRFADFYEAHQDDYRAFAARAEDEALVSVHPDAARSYLGDGAAGPRFLLAPLLPEAAAAGVSVELCGGTQEASLRPSRYTPEGGHRFGFDELAGSPAHELVRAAVAAMAPDASEEMREPLVRAVVLRIIARELGEPIYFEMSQRYSGRGARYLAPLGERLKEYEAHRDRYKSLKDFYPRLTAVYGEVGRGEESASPAEAELRRLKDAGVKDFVEHRFDAAAEKFAAALKLAPRDAEAFLDLGVVYEMLGRKAEALESYDRAVEFGDAGSARGLKVKSAAESSRAALRARERGAR